MVMVDDGEKGLDLRSSPGFCQRGIAFSVLIPVCRHVCIVT